MTEDGFVMPGLMKCQRETTSEKEFMMWMSWKGRVNRWWIGCAMKDCLNRRSRRCFCSSLEKFLQRGRASETDKWTRNYLHQRTSLPESTGAIVSVAVLLFLLLCLS